MKETLFLDGPMFLGKVDAVKAGSLICKVLARPSVYTLLFQTFSKHCVNF